MGDELERARRVKAQLGARLGPDARVQGLGIAMLASGHGVRVLVRDSAAAAELALPALIDGVPVEVVAIGDVRASG